MRAALLFPLFLPAVAFGADGAFRFVQVTDTHLGELGHEARLDRIIKMVNELPYDIAFVAVTGDITSDRTLDTNLLDSVTNRFARFRFPVQYLPGNHDIEASPRSKTEATVSNWESWFGPLSHVYETSGVTAVFFFSESLREGYKVADYRPLEWLSNALSNAKGDSVLVFQHSPAHEDFYNNAPHSGWPEKTKSAWEALLNADGRVKGVFCGHYHRDEADWAGNVPVFVSSSVAGFWKRQGSFRIYTLSNGRISYNTQYLE